MFASTSIFVSCKDYDDDIDNLQKQITTNATDLESLVAEKQSNVQKLIDALTTQQTDLDAAYKAADATLAETIKQATNDANGYADVQAAEAQKAAIAAAQNAIDEAVAKLQKSLDDANDAITANEGKIANLIQADKDLTTAIQTAQAKADEAYTLAQSAQSLATTNKANIDTNTTGLAELKKSYEAFVASMKDVPSNLSTIQSSLEKINKDMNVMGDSIKVLLDRTAANSARISADSTQLEDLKASNKTALEALSRKDDVLGKLIKENQHDIDSLAAVTYNLGKDILANDTKAQEYATTALSSAKSYTDTELGGLKTAYQKAEKELKDSIVSLNTKVAGLTTRLNTIDTDLAAINSRLGAVESNLAALVTGIQFQGMTKWDAAGINESPMAGYSVATLRYAKVVTAGAVNFPASKPAGYATLAAADKYVCDPYVGTMFVTVNPNTINFAGQQFYLYNSLDVAKANVVLGKAVKDNTTVLQRAAATKDNGLYSVALSLPKAAFTEAEFTGLVPTTDVAYAVAAQYTTKDYDATTKAYKNQIHKVYSKYEIGFAKQAIPAVSAAGLTLKANSAALSEDVADPTVISALNAKLQMDITGGKDVRAKYLLCTAAYDRNGASTGSTPSAAKTAMNKILGLSSVLYPEDQNFDTLSVNTDYSGFTFALTYYVWNFDGTEVSKTYYMMLTKPLFTEAGNAAIVTTATSAGEQKSKVAESSFDTLNCMVANNSEWKKNTKKVVVSNLPAGISSVQFCNANGVAIAPECPNGTTDISAAVGSAKDIVVTYNPTLLNVGQKYTFKMVFKDKNNQEVSVANVDFTMKVPTSLDGKVSRIPSAFTGDLTIAWAKLDPLDNTKSYYKMDGSFNSTTTWLDAANSYVRFAPKGTPTPTITMVGGATTVSVPNASVVSKQVYNMYAGTAYYGLAKLWASIDTFQLKFQSPIEFASWTAKTPTVGYPGTVTLNQNNLVKVSTDPSVASHDPIYYFDAPTRDARIAKVEVFFADAKDGNNGLFVEPTSLSATTATVVPATGLALKTGTSVSLTTDTPVKFILRVTDVFGCVIDHEFTVTVLKQ